VDDLAAFLGIAALFDLNGVSVTIPHKEAAANLAPTGHWLRRLGAANTLARTTITATYVGGVYDNTSPTAISLSGTSTVYLTAHVDFFGSAAEMDIGGADTQVQFNDGGAFAGDSGFTFDKTNNALTLGGATVTTSKPVLDLSQTWNAVGTTFTGLKFNVTDTASAAASLLMDLQVGTVSKFSVAKSGVVGMAAGVWHGTPTAAIYFAASNGIAFRCNADIGAWLSTPSAQNGLQLTAGALFGWTSNTTDASSGNPDLRLYRDAANTLALRNSTNAQTFNHYGRYTSATDYSRLAVKHATTTLTSVSGATVTATGLIPAKAFIIGVNSKITVALGVTGGTTGYAVGDGTDPNRWGDVVGTATTVASAGADATANPTGWFNAANDVVITAAGGNFDGTGSIYLDVAYLITEAD
jgi:hypothetical protein